MISILMPVFNGSEYLRESLSSVVAQTSERWELLIGINGYPEGSEIWKKIYKYNSRRIRVFDIFHCKSKSEALNELVTHAMGKWVCLLDVDDIWLPNKLSVQSKYLDSYQVIGTDARYFGDRNDSPGIPLNEISKETFKTVNPIINSSAMFLKEDARWEEIKGVEDYELWCRLAAKGRKFFNVPEVLTLHRIHKDSAFNNESYDDSIAALRAKHLQ